MGNTVFSCIQTEPFVLSSKQIYWRWEISSVNTIAGGEHFVTHPKRPARGFKVSWNHGISYSKAKLFYNLLYKTFVSLKEYSALRSGIHARSVILFIS